jgi:hypothetical protein
VILAVFCQILREYIGSGSSRFFSRNRAHSRSLAAFRVVLAMLGEI